MSTRRWTRGDLARLWWGERRVAAVGCGLSLGMGALVMIAVALAVWPVANSETVEGQVRSFGLAETDFGSQGVAYVTYKGQQDRIPVRPADDCRVGDRIRLHTTRHLWGGYTAGIYRDGRPPCRRAS